jgi:putative RNA 2'-phosphotransferase
VSDPWERHSRFLSYALRHEPGKAGIVLDGAGWCGVDAVLAALQRQHLPLTRADLDQVVATNPKQRFELDADARRIRARQGHSHPVELGLEPRVPPEYLYHGTATRFLDAILAQGLVKGDRHHVHLSADPATATAVGGRHGSPVILVVAAARMHAAGHLFFRTDNLVWLVDGVPAGFLSRE